MSLQGPYLVHTVQQKPMLKAQISGRMAYIGISDVVTARNVASGTDRTFRLHVAERSSIVSVFDSEAFSQSYFSFFHLLVKFFLLW